MQVLVRAGYFDCGEMNVPGRFAFRQPGYGQRDAAWGDHKGSEMRSDEELRKEYAHMKMQLTEQDFANIGECAMGKNEIPLGILKKASWSEEDLEEVRRANS
jgi:hypothetical protein